MRNDLVLKVKNLNVVLEGEEIIKDLTFEVKERETLIILTLHCPHTPCPPQRLLIWIPPMSAASRRVFPSSTGMAFPSGQKMTLC